jgi:hypothetical protein
MGNYLFAYRGGSMAQTQEERDAAMAAWGAWFGQLGSAIVDAGNPFAGSASVGSDGTVSEGAGSGLGGLLAHTGRQPRGGLRAGQGQPGAGRRRQRGRV